MASSSIYVRCSSGFGNKIFDLISAIYLKNKYKTNVLFATDKSIHEKTNDPFFGNIFYKSHVKIKYIYMNTYYRLKESLPIKEIWVDNLSDLPEKITDNVRFGGLYKFAYTMYSSFDENDRKLFEINPKLLNYILINKYINDQFACVHIRYGDKLCYSLEEFKQTKYTPFMLPIYTPQFYIDQIEELLKKDIDKILIMTDSVSVVEKYIFKKFKDNPKIVLLDSHYLDSFYLLSKARYIILSYGTFSFAAAYFNPNAVCYLTKKYVTNPEKDFIYEDYAISPKWIIIDNKEYLLNFDQKLLKKMVIDYGNCDKYIRKQSGGKIYNHNAKKIRNKEFTNLLTNGPITIINSNISSKLIIYGTLNFQNLNVNGSSKIFGTVYGKKGIFNNLEVYGTFDVENITIKKLLCTGTFYASRLDIEKNASINGPIYVSNSIFKNIEVLSENMKFIDTNINKITINNSDNKPKKISFENCKIDKLIIVGHPLNINISYDTDIKKNINGTLIVGE